MSHCAKWECKPVSVVREDKSEAEASMWITPGTVYLVWHLQYDLPFISLPYPTLSSPSLLPPPSAHSFSAFYFVKSYICACISVWVCTCEHRCSWRPDTLAPLEGSYRLQVTGSLIMWMLGTKFRSSVRAVCALSPSASPQPQITSLLYSFFFLIRIVHSSSHLDVIMLIKVEQWSRIESGIIGSNN